MAGQSPGSSRFAAYAGDSGNLNRVASERWPAYPPAIAFVALIGSFNALQRADKFASRGRTRSDSQK